ncbi:class I SAM-dependent methyltransferase [Flavobacterium hibisci]|uniref:class I SAM-dependent methyltransferase n=1 Tax=Flavobacterium hibisci TaxID=1914462 RepID=UPI001CBE168F|nr:class I SAM-dependent methyltransferase [Flavobacterium hibisci]MBZ4041953.1 class I SAM-dependent methyltransferase [Flavobacterium hibisci]
MGKIEKKTGERLEFYNFSNVTVEHLHRYALAVDFIKDKIVLDIASGEGYGSYMLSKSALSVTGVDIDQNTIKNAQSKYVKDNLNYIVGSADEIPVESKSIDVVVSFETIEHHDKHDEMFAEIKRILKPDGVLIMSSPDKKYYSDLTGQVNPFHIRELYFEEFKSLSKRFFLNTDFYYQVAYNLNSYINHVDDFEKTVIYRGDNFDLKKLTIEPVYNILIASSIQIEKVGPSIFDGIEISKKINDHIKSSMITNIKKTFSYRIGNFLIYPFFLIKRVIKK